MGLIYPSGIENLVNSKLIFCRMDKKRLKISDKTI